MFKIFVMSLVLASTSFAAEFDPKAEECVNKASTALGLSLDKEHGNIKLAGTGCALSIERNEYVSGLNNLPVVELRLDGSGGEYLSLNANEGLGTVNVSKCEVTASSISLKYSGKNKTGWGGSYSQTVNLSLVDGKVVSANLVSKQGGWMSGGKVEKFNCQF